MNARSPTPLPDRQRQLLALLDALGDGVRDAELWGLLVLYGQEAGVTAPYEVVWSAAGPVSFTCDADRRKLVERGFLVEGRARWELTELGRSEATKHAGPAIRAFARGRGALRGAALGAVVQQSAVLGSVEGPVLATIGYEGRSLEGYLNELLRAGVTLLCDVRRNPLSRKFGFAKGTLAKACATVGIRYEHLPELGIASEQRKSLETQAEYDALFDEYARETLPREGAALSKIEGWMRAGERVALTCYEKAPEQCHRHCVADVLEQRLDVKARGL